MRRIGNVSVGANNIILAVDKEAYGQGYIFKDEDAFYYQPYEPCYVAEHQDVGDVAWCFHSFLELTGGRKALAAYLFESVDWQSPSSLLDEELEPLLEKGIGIEKALDMLEEEKKGEGYGKRRI